MAFLQWNGKFSGIIMEGARINTEEAQINTEEAQINAKEAHINAKEAQINAKEGSGVFEERLNLSMNSQHIR